MRPKRRAICVRTRPSHRVAYMSDLEIAAAKVRLGRGKARPSRPRTDCGLLWWEVQRRSVVFGSRNGITCENCRRSLSFKFGSLPPASPRTGRTPRPRPRASSPSRGR